MAAGRQFKLQKLLEFSHFLEDHIGPPPSLHNSDTGAREGRTQVLLGQAASCYMRRSTIDQIVQQEWFGAS